MVTAIRDAKVVLESYESNISKGKACALLGLASCAMLCVVHTRPFGSCTPALGWLALAVIVDTSCPKAMCYDMYWHAACLAQTEWQSKHTSRLGRPNA